MSFVCSFCFFFLWGTYWSSFQYSVFFVCSFCFFFVGYVLVIFSFSCVFCVFFLFLIFCGVRIGHLFIFLCFLFFLSVSYFLWSTYWSSFNFPVFVCVISVSFLWGTYWSSFQFSVFFVCSFCVLYPVVPLVHS